MPGRYDNLENTAAIQCFKSAKLYMRIALECAEEGDAEGAYFWRDHMAYNAFAEAIGWRDRPESIETLVKKPYPGDGMEDALPSTLSDGRDFIADAFAPAAYDPAVRVSTADSDALGAALAELSPPPVVDAPVIEPITTGLLGFFAKKVSAPAPAAEPEKTSSKKLTSLASLLR